MKTVLGVVVFGNIVSRVH